MLKLFLIIFLFICNISLSAIDYTGMYSFNKGVNKANGTLLLFQLKNDSAFFYLNNVSGDPDFNFLNLKGFLKIDSTQLVFMHDSCNIIFNARNNMIHISQNSKCTFDVLFTEKYKKNIKGIKKSNSWMTEYTEKNGIVNMDSAIVYDAPHLLSKRNGIFKKGTKIKILDEVKGFYLIESPLKQTDFCWTAKKNISLIKN